MKTSLTRDEESADPEPGDGLLAITRGFRPAPAGLWETVVEQAAYLPTVQDIIREFGARFREYDREEAEETAAAKKFSRTSRKKKR